MKQVLAAALFAMLPGAVLAESQLDRLESVSERMMSATLDAMVRMVEKEGGNPDPLRAALPDMDWDAEYREAGACMLERFVNASSKSAVDQMLDDMEIFIPKMAEMDIDDMDQNANFLPDGVSEAYSMSVNEDCGTTALLLKRLEESGFMAAMMQSMAQN